MIAVECLFSRVCKPSLCAFHAFRNRLKPNQYQLLPTETACNRTETKTRTHKTKTPKLDQLTADSPLSAASSSGSRTVQMPAFQHLLSSIQVRCMVLSFNTLGSDMFRYVFCPWIFVLVQIRVFLCIVSTQSCAIHIHIHIGSQCFFRLLFEQFMHLKDIIFVQANIRIMSNPDTFDEF